MRDVFSEYYTPSEAQFDKLWQEAVFVLDTSILLHIYEYGEKTREWFFKILKKLGELDRLWIPYQVGKEYHDDRLGVISKQRRYYDELTKKLTDAGNVIESAKRKHHPFLDPAELIKEVQDAIKTVDEVVTKAKAGHPDYYDADPLHERLTQLLEGRVGSSTSLEKLTDIYKEGDRRYKAEIPPGFKDQNQKEKPFPKNHGDYVIWCQTIEFAKAKKKPIIFITDDEKEDWWRLHNDRTIGPRAELREEMRSAAAVSFYMYKGDAFIERALTQFLQADEQDKANAVEEAKAVREKQEVHGELPAGAFAGRGNINRSHPAYGVTIVEPILPLRSMQDGVEYHTHLAAQPGEVISVSRFMRAWGAQRWEIIDQTDNVLHVVMQLSERPDLEKFRGAAREYGFVVEKLYSLKG